MDWETAQRISGTFQNAIASVAVIIGASWAYFRFVRFRTLKPRLEFSFEWSRSDIDDSHSLAMLTVKLANKGQTKVQLRKGNDPRCFLKYALIPESRSDVPVALLSVPSKRLEHIDAAFVPHRWVEPGETIDDVKVLKINKAGLLAIQFELVVFGLQKWSATSAFPLVGDSPSESCKSEDEQDEYEEAEALREGLRNVLARIRKLGESDRAPFQSTVEEIEVLLGGFGAGSTFLSQAERLIKKAEEALRSVS